MSLHVAFLSHQNAVTAESMPRHFRYADFSIRPTRHDTLDTIAPMV